MGSLQNEGSDTKFSYQSYHQFDVRSPKDLEILIFAAPFHLLTKVIL